MRLFMGNTGFAQAMNAATRRQSRGVALCLALVLTACGESGSPNPQGSIFGQSPNKAGLADALRGGTIFAGVAADESRAAEVGRDVLLNGGNAADAAVAMYFTMAVTLPSAASLGAAGACIVHTQKTRTDELFAFAPTAAPGPIGGVSFNVPMGVRAITLMHIRHGSARWEQLVAPAERLARFGIPVSRALARDLQVGASALSDREARRIFGKGTGTAVTEGDNWTQGDLAGTLGTLRQGGGNEFFAGRLARVLSDQVAQMGGSLPVEVLRNTAPQTGTPPSEPFINGHRVYVAPPPLAGAAALAGWNGQASSGGVATDSGGFAGFIAVDSNGNAVACSLSMGQLFGARVIVPGTGVLLGAMTADAAAASPVLIGSPNNGELLFVGAGGGSASAAGAAGAIARATVQSKASVAQALAALGGRGGHVNAIACPGGLRGNVVSCSGGTDPSGFGLALSAIPNK